MTPRENPDHWAYGMTEQQYADAIADVLQKHHDGATLGIDFKPPTDTVLGGDYAPRVR